MRSVALDLGVNEISFCEVAGGAVLLRRTVRLDELTSPTRGTFATSAPRQERERGLRG